MRKRHDKYPIEASVEKLFIELRRSLKKITKFFFIIPKKKMDKYIYVIETVSWLLFTIALILRIGR